MKIAVVAIVGELENPGRDGHFTVGYRGRADHRGTASPDSVRPRSGSRCSSCARSDPRSPRSARARTG
ncbi:hypothetical protein AORI_4074 [Amycolatopsis keratiniphila]|uniref:Uncharacterized protein n=1 Tax=Amycolatopsis keratiniphila TaxID=129921 RepID=R4STC7_9PSEU|nr:hypothetical protein AORI_4074 [Amycolatopsis keratiniphila]